MVKKLKAPKLGFRVRYRSSGGSWRIFQNFPGLEDCESIDSAASSFFSYLAANSRDSLGFSVIRLEYRPSSTSVWLSLFTVHSHTV